MFTDLRAEGHINANDDDIDFLVSFITLFGRFWISEATIFDKSPDVTQAIKPVSYTHLDVYKRQR